MCLKVPALQHLAPPVLWLSSRHHPLATNLSLQRPFQAPKVVSAPHHNMEEAPPLLALEPAPRLARLLGCAARASHRGNAGRAGARTLRAQGASLEGPQRQTRGGVSVL